MNLIICVFLENGRLYVRALLLAGLFLCKMSYGFFYIWRKINLMMLILIIFVLVFFLIIGAVLGGNNTESKDNSSKSISLEVPNPSVVPLKFLEFLKTVPSEYLWQIEMNLDESNVLNNYIIKKAIDDRRKNGNFNFTYYEKLIKRLEAGNYNIDDKDIQQEFSYRTNFKIAGLHLEARKKKILLELEEGSDVILKREPYNTYDSNAISVVQNDTVLGYVPKTDNIEIGEIIKNKFIAKVADVIYKDDFLDVIIYLYTSNEINDNPQYYYDNATILNLRQRKIESKFLRPKKDAEDVNMFFRKKVVITGEFENFYDRNELAELLYESGADVDTAITERTHYVIVGKDAGWRKLERIEDFGIMTFSEEEILKIFGTEK